MILKKFFSEGNARSLKARKNIIGSFIVKGASVVINLLLIRITISYLDETRYGIWLTISSIFAWINLFDVGLGNGLRNKLAEALAKDDMKRAKTLVSTAYISITVLCLALAIIFSLLNYYFLNWNAILKIPSNITEDFNSIALLIFFMFAIQFILQLINSVLYSTQQSFRVSMFGAISNLVIVISLTLLPYIIEITLFKVMLVFTAIPVLVSATVNLYYFRTKFKDFAPGLSYFNKSALKDVLNLGLQFFVIQMAALIFFQSTNVLICQLMGNPKFVTPYSISYRYFGTMTMIFGMVVSPFWSAITEAYTKREFEWIEKSIRQLTKVWIVITVVGIGLLLVSGIAYPLLTKNKTTIDLPLSITMMIYNTFICFGNIYVVVVNGIGNIRLQMIFGVIGMIIFFPLAYFLTVTLQLGLPGMVISTIICSLYGPIIAPIEVRKMLSKNLVKA